MGTDKIQSYHWPHAGIYNITLTITNTYNETDTKTRSLTIQANTPPTATFTHTPSHPHVNDQITFDASSSHDSDGEIVSYAWDWDNNGIFDDTVYTATEYHLWTTPGTYPVTLKVMDNNGGINTTTQTISVTETSPPTDNRPPVADFSYIPQEPTVLDIISFRDLSTDTDGWVVDWLWNFGDGATSTHQHPGHQYTTTGIYTLRLTVTDDMDATHTLTHDITIRNVPPTASFTTLPSSPITVNQIITFNSTSIDPDGTIINWTWNLEENITTYGETITHTYTQDGIFNISLTVTDNNGDTDTTTLPLTIQKKDATNNTSGFEFLALLTATTIILYIRKKQHT
jgi:PKD repeat protein